MISKDIFDAVSNAYGSILDQNGWAHALDSITASFEGRGAVIVLQESDLAFDGFNGGSDYYRNFPDRMFERYQAEYSHHEAPAWNKIATMPPGKIMRDTEMGIPITRLEAQPHYIFGRERLNIRRRIGFRITDNDAWFDAIAIAYDSALDTPPSHIETTAALLTPHLGKALEMGRAFSLLKRRYGAVLSTLDKFGIGVAIAGAAGEVIVSNTEAKRILEEGSAIRMQGDGKISTHDADMTARIRHALQQASMTAAGKNDVLTAPLQLERMTAGMPVLLDITALHDSTAEIEQGMMGAVIFLIDMERPPSLDIPRFARLYNLTGAEMEVCAMMIEGHSTTIIAEKRNTSPHTVHNQARAVLSKTGCNNRGILLRLIVKTLPPVA